MDNIFDEDISPGSPENKSELQRQKDMLKLLIMGKGSKATSDPRKKEVKQISHFLIDKELGEGTFGKVKLGIQTITQEKVAIKILEKSKISDQMDIDRIAREIKILKKIRHPRIIQLYQIIETESELYLIMEHANAGELFDYIVKYDRVDDVNAANFFNQILDGVEHLHKHGVCHRDLKPENLLLEKNSTNLKIIDFGLSNMYSKPTDTLQTACGSPCYAAPEMIAGKQYNGLSVDIWSCGVILFAMLCGYLPFEDPNTDKLYKKICNCDYSIPNYISEQGKDLIRKILNTDPDDRYNLMQIRSHPWFVNNLEKFNRQNNKFNDLNDHLNPNECKINPQIIIDMVEKYKLPQKPSKSGEPGPSHTPFEVYHVLKSLAHNKHNDSTTTYYLLHKKWLQSLSLQGPARQSRISPMRPKQSSYEDSFRKFDQQTIILTTQNYEQVSFKLKHQIEKKNAQQSPERVRNMIKIDSDENQLNHKKMAESVSLVIKTPAAKAQKVSNLDQIFENNNEQNHDEQARTPTKHQLSIKDQKNSPYTKSDVENPYINGRFQQKAYPTATEKSKQDSNQQYDKSFDYNSNPFVPATKAPPKIEPYGTVTVVSKGGIPVSSNSQTTDRTAHNSKRTTAQEGGTATSRDGPTEPYNAIQEYSSRKPTYAQKIPTHRNRNLLENFQPPRYKSQMRGTDFNFKGPQSKFNVSSYKRDKTPNVKPHDTSRDRSRADSNTSRISRVSWSNVSYQSNFSAIRNDIMKFKNKKLKNMNDSFGKKRDQYMTQTGYMTRFDNKSPLKANQKKQMNTRTTQIYLGNNKNSNSPTRELSPTTKMKKGVLNSRGAGNISSRSRGFGHQTTFNKVRQQNNMPQTEKLRMTTARKSMKQTNGYGSNQVQGQKVQTKNKNKAHAINIDLQLQDQSMQSELQDQVNYDSTSKQQTSFGYRKSTMASIPNKQMYNSIKVNQNGSPAKIQSSRNSSAMRHENTVKVKKYKNSFQQQQPASTKTASKNIGFGSKLSNTPNDKIISKSSQKHNKNQSQHQNIPKVMVFNLNLPQESFISNSSTPKQPYEPFNTYTQRYQQQPLVSSSSNQKESYTDQRNYESARNYNRSPYQSHKPSSSKPEPKTSQIRHRKKISQPYIEQQSFTPQVKKNEPHTEYIPSQNNPSFREDNNTMKVNLMEDNYEDDLNAQSQLPDVAEYTPIVSNLGPQSQFTYDLC